MKKIDENLQYFIENHKDVYEAYQGFGKALHNEGGPLDEKTRALLKIAISTTCQYEYALRTHINKAVSSGCTREEIEHAILLTASTAGFPRMMEGIMVLREELDK